MDVISKVYIILLTLPVAAGAARAQLPHSIAALGDSITRAALADNTIAGLAFGQPEHSWITGNDAEDGVQSHYERIEAAADGTNLRAWNFAVSGAKADDLPGQAVAAVMWGAEYVVLQIGGNDVCADHLGEMTPTAAFERDLDTTLETLQTGLPDAVILVTEVVRVRRVFDAGKLRLGCWLRWVVFGWCDNVLRNGSQQRAAADARNIEYNEVLRNLCEQRGVPFADNVFEIPFARQDLSNVDCFHMSESGQNRLAETTYDPSRF
ncbi:MAG: hypothetical protein HYV26_04655 [Candidatus Hydrogenedentes bacterium]|nr:hypothetical protein [Candidatus Hydrogenedentota bacterium]MBI3119720.1 hypothetical protein [Candidatus Hydrogenedentota bacterium]